MSYTFSLSRRSLPVRCLCLLLIVLVLWCFFMVPRAGAVAVEAATVAYAGALVGTILVGAGVIFSSHGDMQKVGAAMYKSWVHSSNAIGSKISAIAAWAVEHGEAAAKGALRVGRELYQDIIDTFNASYSNGYFSDGQHFSISESASKSEVESFGAAIGALMVSGSNVVISGYVASQYSGTPESYKFDISYPNGVWQCTLTVNGKAEQPITLSNVDAGSVRVEARMKPLYAKTCAYVTLNNYYGWYFYAPTVLSVGGVSYPVNGSDLAYPSDNTLVRMPDIPSVDTDTGEAVFPSDAAYTKDAVSVPYPTDADGVKVPDIPFDKVVDQSTGKALDDTGTDTENPSKPGEGTDTGSNTGLLQKILDLLKNFFDSPSDFRLNMDGFRNLAIKDKFPFCIPFDMVDSVKQFAADAADYQFRVKLDTQYFKVDHVVDLTPLAVPLAFFRYLVVAWFAWVLMSRTHDLMKW